MRRPARASDEAIGSGDLGMPRRYSVRRSQARTWPSTVLRNHQSLGGGYESRRKASMKRTDQNLLKLALRNPSGNVADLLSGRRTRTSKKGPSVVDGCQSLSLKKQRRRNPPSLDVVVERGHRTPLSKRPNLRKVKNPLDENPAAPVEEKRHPASQGQESLVQASLSQPSKRKKSPRTDT